MNGALKYRLGCLLCVVVFMGPCLLAQSPSPGKNTFVLRGKRQEVYFLPSRVRPPMGRILYAPGDGGWRGFAIAIAQRMASAGYDVYGLDTKHYLMSFTGKKVLTTSEIARDFRTLAEWARRGSDDPVFMVGWSEGAGLGLAAVAAPQNRSVFAGLVTVGMAENSLLALHWSDLLAEVTRSLPHEPTFPSADFVGRIAPLPLAMISSTRDVFVSEETARRLFGLAREPKRLILIDAKDHKFSGRENEFFRVLMQSLVWVRTEKP